MIPQINLRKRKEYQQKMSVLFARDMETLSPELQEIFLDDMITAFENRLSVIIRAK